MQDRTRIGRIIVVRIAAFFRLSPLVVNMLLSTGISLVIVGTLTRGSNSASRGLRTDNSPVVNQCGLVLFVSLTRGRKKEAGLLHGTIPAYRLFKT